MNINLLKKYNKAGPRYTSYPPANFFHQNITSDDYKKHLTKSNTDEPQDLSFYFHVPFCPQLCHFCGCNTMGMQNADFIKRYFNAIKTEIKNVTSLLDKKRKLTQIHWGGGTPNSVSLNYIEEVMQMILAEFELDSKAEIAMECNPAYMTLNQIERLKDMGFNRLSIE